MSGGGNMGLSLKAQHSPLSDTGTQLHFLKNSGSFLPFGRKLAESGLHPLKSTGISVLQVNVGKVCNLSCKHCHVDAGPDRTESMDRETFNSCLKALAEAAIPTLDITGGAPECNPHLTWFIEEAIKLGCKVIVRTNLAILETEQRTALAEFYASLGVELVASLPYYQKKYTDRQRGEGAFDASVRVLKKLNRLGYGRENGRLQLNLVYNPGGAFLPPAQQAIESEFRRELMRRYGIFFNHLFTITNVPVGRFLDFLLNTGNLNRYMERLSSAFNPVAASGVMCRSQVSVGWDGKLYDCDFNQMLDLPCAPEVPGHISDFNGKALRNRRIVVENHCYACTAGAGSSCGGTITDCS